MKESQKYYDNRVKGLIEDYVQGNKRMEDAIENLSEFIPSNSQKIGDLGCGIGWSSFEFARFFPESKVDGIDLSPLLIQNGKKLFQSENLYYYIKDLTKDKLVQEYDCIVMIDVYEHIPLVDRKSFHDSLRKNLSNKGRLILACPTKFHQNWLRNNKPTGLQPVDEDVDCNTILQIAKDVNGEIVFFEYRKIWNSNDYLYAVIQLDPQFNSSSSLRNGKKFKLEHQAIRAKRVKENLGLKIKPIEVKESSIDRKRRFANGIRKLIRKVIKK